MSIKPPQYFLRPPPPPTALGVGGGGELRGGAAAPQRAAARGRAAARPGGHLGALRGCRGPPGSARYRARPRRGHVRRRHVGPARRYGGRCGPKVPGERRAGAEGSLRFFFLSLFFFFFFARRHIKRPAKCPDVQAPGPIKGAPRGSSSASDWRSGAPIFAPGRQSEAGGGLAGGVRERDRRAAPSVREAGQWASSLGSGGGPSAAGPLPNQRHCLWWCRLRSAAAVGCGAVCSARAARPGPGTRSRSPGRRPRAR